MGMDGKLQIDKDEGKAEAFGAMFWYASTLPQFFPLLFIVYSFWGYIGGFSSTCSRYCLVSSWIMRIVDCRSLRMLRVDDLYFVCQSSGNLNDMDS
jgi:hypothetical protein